VSPSPGGTAEKRNAQVPFAVLSAAAIGALLLAGAAPAPKPAPPPKASPHASAEPTAAQLPPVDPAWRQNGWHAVVPHGYVLRALAPARVRPETSAPAAFWLKGGVRVPILEQRSQWWRVGWTHGQTGWIPAADLQPHASFILIDVQTGRVLRRLAAKGEQGPVAAGGFLWSFSDTGITRTSLGEPPAIWSNPVHPDQDDSLPAESVWTPDRSAFFVRAKPNDMGPPGPRRGSQGLASHTPSSRLLFGARPYFVALGGGVRRRTEAMTAALSSLEGGHPSTGCECSGSAVTSQTFKCSRSSNSSSTSASAS
jgi:hypothetical protein